MSFKRSAEEVAGPLDEMVSEEETEAMKTARANILGTLENLLNQDLARISHQLAKGGDLGRGSEPAGWIRGGVAAMGAIRSR